jgi:hypothetical protein
MPERFIMATRDGTLVQTLNRMRAARRVFEYEQSRWIITRIVLDGDKPETANASWSVFGQRARV